MIEFTQLNGSNNMLGRCFLLLHLVVMRELKKRCVKRFANYFTCVIMKPEMCILQMGVI